MTNQLVLTINKLSSGEKIVTLSIFSLFQNYVLEKILVFVLLEHQLNSNLRCERGGGEVKRGEERRNEVDNHSYTRKFRTKVSFGYWWYLFHLM